MAYVELDSRELELDSRELEMCPCDGIYVCPCDGIYGET